MQTYYESDVAREFEARALSESSLRALAKRVQEEMFPFLIASSSAVSDDDMHKLPASRDERADGGHGSESLR